MRAKEIQLKVWADSIQEYREQMLELMKQAREEEVEKARELLTKPKFILNAEVVLHRQGQGNQHLARAFALEIAMSFIHGVEVAPEKEKGHEGISH